MFPAGLRARLDAAGLPAFYVPTEWGGRLDDHEVLLRLPRSVARRDVSAAVAHGKTCLGTACVWIAGSPEQAASTAAVLAGGPVAGHLRAHPAQRLPGHCPAAAAPARRRSAAGSNAGPPRRRSLWSRAPGSAASG